MPDISNTPAVEPDRFNDPDYGYNQGLSQEEELAIAGFTDAETRDTEKHPYDYTTEETMDFVPVKLDELNEKFEMGDIWW